MSGLALIQAFLARVQKEANINGSPPPPYSFSGNPYADLGIKATNAPQWLWSKAQCQAWVFAVCNDLLGYTEEESAAVAARFEGFGPRLFAMDYTHWQELVGNLVDGESVYTLVYSLRSKGGAMPGGITFAHIDARAAEMTSST